MTKTMDATQVAEDPLPRPLAEHADDHGECFIRSPGPLERMTELSKRRMAKVLDPLGAAQLIFAERGGFAGLTRYRLLLDGPEAGASGSTEDGSRPADQVRSLDGTGSSQDGSDTAIH
jgi:hypothetical protein